MSQPAKPIYEFGSFRLDTTQYRLLRQGKVVPLAPKEFDMLLVLIERRGQVVSKDDLLKTVWPDTIVEETNLTVIISALRKALGESAEEKYIETIPQRGYRFIAPVSEVGDEGAALILHEITQARLVVEEEKKVEDRGWRMEDRRSSIARPASLSSRYTLLGLLLLVVLAAALSYFWMKSPSPPTEPLATVKSIAVLPFKPLRADESEEYLGLGMADTLITKLSNLRQLIVRPTSAVRRYTSPEQDPLAAGREQQVEAVLEGSIQRVGERVRVTVRLLRVKGGAPIWASQYDEKMTDILAVQDSISERVAGALAVTLTDQEKEQLTKPYTNNAKAYDFYLIGRYHLNQVREDAFLKSLDYFQQAVEKDPSFALAYAGLAQSYNLLGVFNALRANEAFPKARSAALMALKLDNWLAPAHTALAMVKHAYDWDWPGAEQEFRRAIEINPSDSEAHHAYGYFLAFMSRFDEAVAEMKRAQELEPVSPGRITGLAQALLYARRYDEAITECRKALEMDPNFLHAHWTLGLSYIYKGMYEQALRALEKSVPPTGDCLCPDEQSAIGLAYALSGQRGQARKVIDELKRQSERRYLPPAAMAAIYGALGEKDQAFRWLDRAYDQRDNILVLLRVEPMFDPLRSDPRFADLLRRVGLTP
jgi:DNA-binding winged helix-turn-helix (wHTH) protein/TolB-like protein/Flp pilus assembly protein TadD